MTVDIESCTKSTQVVPCLFALLPNKCQDTYERLFKMVKDYFEIDIKHFKCKFEISQQNAIQVVFPNSEVSGCYYNFNAAVWGKSDKYNKVTWD